ncbi:sorbitol dehydrogenase-like [Liolophura sinensis]|uniref:sorbitol dehydrogenase-like n=1 Tax=Liolophura sinensis TaxID=3198878 RepID=UPI0031584AB5
MSMDANLSAVLYKKGDLRLEDRTVPEPGPGEVQISMHSVGICGSDVHYWHSGAIGHFVVKNPMLLGHECSGTVSKVGKGVTHLREGDRVAIEPGVPCRKCEVCRNGRYNLCQDVFFLATPPDNGALARYHTHAADFCYKLPNSVSFEEGALIEPLSVGLHACRRGGVTLGHVVVVCGAGPIGLSAMLSAKAMGASVVCMTVNLDSKRLEFAKAMGATHTVLIESKDVVAFTETVINTLWVRPDVVVECSGAQFSIDLAIGVLKPGGVLVMVGHGPDNVSIPASSTIAREIEIRGSFRYKNTWKAALDMVASGAINVKPMVTHHFPLEKTLDAFNTAKSGAGIKVIIDCFRE